MPIGLVLLSLAEESLMPVQGCTSSVQCVFCRHFSMITDFEVPVYQSVAILLLWIITCKSAVILSFICICMISWGGILHSQKSESSEDMSKSLESVSIVSSSVSSCDFSSIAFTFFTYEGFLYVFSFEVSFQNLTDLNWILNFVFCGWLLVVLLDLG